MGRKHGSRTARSNFGCLRGRLWTTMQGRPSTSSNILTGSMSVRFAHTDLQVPDLTSYKLAPSQGRENFHNRERERKGERKSFLYTVTAGLGVGGVYCAT